MKTTYQRRLKLFTQLALLSSAVILSGCGGDNDKETVTDNSQPPVVTPPAAPVTVTQAQQLNIDVTAATYTNGALTVNYTVTDEEGYGFVASADNTNNVRFIANKLIPAENGDASYWQSFLTKTETADIADFPESVTTAQATNQSASEENPVTNNNDGTYSYTFSGDFANMVDALTGEVIAWDENLTHRVAIEFRKTSNNPAANGHYDWVPSGDNLTDTRDIVAIESCNNCHTNLAFHGGNRVDTAYCVTCHNPGSEDSQSGNTVDFKVMVHKIHRGANLPGVAAAGDGAKYSIFGYRTTEHTYAENTEGSVTGTNFPQDIRNCTNCHVSAEDKAENPSVLATATVDGDNWKTNATVEACGSCHDNTAFNDEMLVEQPYLVKHEGLFPVTNQECSTCHAPGKLYEAEAMHTNAISNAAKAAESIHLEALEISAAEGGFNVVIEIAKDGVPATSFDDIRSNMYRFNKVSRGALGHPYVMANWDNGAGYEGSYSNNHFNLDDCVAATVAGEFNCFWDTSGLNNGEPITTGTVAVSFADAEVCINASNDVNNGQFAGQLADCTGEGDKYVPSKLNKTYFDVATLAVTDGYAEKFGASIEACQSCHSSDASFHHGATDFAQCTSCHNSTRAAFYAGKPADLKFNVHSKHKVTVKDYPSPINNCSQCHAETQIDLPLQQNHRASFTAGPVRGEGMSYTSPTATVCASCHVGVPVGYIDEFGAIKTDAEGANYSSYGEDIVLSAEEQNVVNHMMTAGGAVFNAATAAEASNKESCATCHAIGSDVAVDAKHGLIK